MNEFICNIHDTIINICKQKVKKNKEKMSAEDIEMFNTIIELTKEAKKSGVSMERRLLQYRCAIEDLGFERVEKKKGRKRNGSANR